jgi:hypothetical protein
MPPATDRLADLRTRYGADVVPASTTAPKAATISKRPKTAATKAPGARLARPGDSQAVPIATPRLVGYARVSTDEQTTRLQLDSLRAAGCVVIHEDAVPGVFRSRPGFSRARTVAGMRAAKRRGEHLGRPAALSPAQVREAKKMLDRGESPNHVARVLRVGRSTLYRAISLNMTT